MAVKAGHLLRRTLLALTGLVVLVALAYLPAVAIITAVSYGYGLADMDWNEDGEVTLREVLASEGIGSRPWSEDRACREFFSLKTGLPVRVDCADRSVGAR